MVGLSGVLVHAITYSGTPANKKKTRKDPEEDTKKQQAQASCLFVCAWLLKVNSSFFASSTMVIRVGSLLVTPVLLSLPIIFCLQGEWGRQSGGRGEAKGLSWLQWLLANLLILLVAATVVLAIFGQRMFAASGRQAAVATTPGFVLRPDASLRKPPPFVPPRPTHRKAEDAGRKRNVPPKLSGRSTRRRTTHNFKVTRHRKGASSSTELSKSTTDD